MDVSNLSLNEKLGQRFMFGINNSNINEIFKLIKNAYIGGVILYKKNYKTYDDMLKVINQLKEANKDNKIPLFIAIDEEGGRVNRLPKEIHNLKNIYDVSKKDINLVTDYACVIGKVLKETGINMNLAPVLDIYNGSKSKALYKRCFYGECDRVTDSATKYINEINKMIIPVIKHYPGHGLTTKDTHFTVPYIFDLSKYETHVKPFEKLINNNVDALMVGHFVIPKVTGLLPTSISARFLNNLRKKHNGLIITDEINMLKRNPIYCFIYKNKALKTDSDILLVKVKDAREGYKLIDKYRQILTNDVYQVKLDESIERIIKIKDKYKINDEIIKSGINIEKINKDIDLINEKALKQ